MVDIVLLRVDIIVFSFSIRKSENVSKAIDKDTQGKLYRNANHGESV